MCSAYFISRNTRLKKKFSQRSPKFLCKCQIIAHYKPFFCSSRLPEVKTFFFSGSLEALVNLHRSPSLFLRQCSDL